jgi:hypothetical protein
MLVRSALGFHAFSEVLVNLVTSFVPFPSITVHA